MSSLVEVYELFVSNVDKFLSVLELCLQDVKKDIENGDVDTNMFLPDPSIVISTVRVMVKDQKPEDLLFQFAQTYHPYWDELFSAECSIVFFQKNFSKFFSMVNLIEGDNETGMKGQINKTMNEILTLKKKDGTQCVGDSYVKKIIEYFRSFSRSSLKSLLMRRQPIKKINMVGRPYPVFIFKNNQLLPEIDVSKCLFFYRVDVTKLLQLENV